MFGTSGIRGPVGEDVTGAVALSVGRALGVDADRAVLGRDPRESGELLADALAAGLRESGTDVVDLGLAATPTVARAVSWEHADVGVVITASHNPARDNGIKLWQPSGQAFDSNMRETIAARIREEASVLVPWDDLGERKRVSATDRHRDTLVESVEISDPPRVVVDVGNGAGGVTTDALEALGCDVQTLNAQPDGAFPGRPSEPTAEHCEGLAAIVGNTDADVGIAHDGDADRMRAATADGTFLPGDVLLALLAADAAEPGETVAVPVDTSLAVEDHLAARDIDVRRTPVGDVFVAAAASETGVVFGGEPSGAWIWPSETLCPDGPLAACRLAALTAERSLADRAGEVETYPIQRANITVEDNAAVMERVSETVPATEPADAVSELDGIRVDRENGWYLIRASGTQPLIRVTAEARAQADAADLLATAKEIVEGARST